MRITIVQGAFLPVPPILGGAVEKIWFALGQEFASRGHSVTHVSRRNPELAEEELLGGVRHIRVPGFDIPESMVRLKWRDFRYSRRALKVLPNADVLVTNTFWLPVLSRNSEQGRIYVHVARYPKGQIKFYGKASRLQTVSGTVKEAICREAPSLASKVRVIPNFVSVPREQSGDTKRKKEILFVGRVHPEKGIHLLVDAFARLVARGFQGWKLRIVGPWELRHGGGGEQYFGDLRRQSQPLGNLVEWTGPVFNAEALGIYYKQSALFVYPSLAERGESFGLAPLEAMAAGCPPVVSSLECFGDFIQPGSNGWIFNHRSADAAAELATVVGEAISEEGALRRAGESGLRTAQEFTLSKVADQFLSDFEEIVRQ